ncbi:hypothetical protein CEE37_08485 [candidate division LCP-89 bacterium B3_LCP]|uniref:Uncharacterized protein n=1 Tax=candidate division LCP-89 bacterium B3_LCP TaxID=2012998 RepID=A0A532UZG9_UNCL8|nr:MAG: hypothetical protein CEE37_08485 [candidate division LCP-89 bacterium B3_LCP]
MDERFKKFSKMMDEMMSGMNDEDKEEMRHAFFDKMFEGVSPEDCMKMCGGMMSGNESDQKSSDAMPNMMMGMMGMMCMKIAFDMMRAGPAIGGIPMRRMRDMMDQMRNEDQDPESVPPTG